jgi:hypothetical protein
MPAVSHGDARGRRPRAIAGPGRRPGRQNLYPALKPIKLYLNRLSVSVSR